jgi:RNA polymerase-binding transcription factor DksA
MADDVDRAQEREQQQRDEAIARIRIALSHVPRDPRVDDDCIDCGHAIEPERLRVLVSTSRCARCAHALEVLHRGMRGT